MENKIMVTWIYWSKILIVHYDWITINYCSACVLETFFVFQTTLCDFRYPLSDLNWCLFKEGTRRYPWKPARSNLNSDPPIATLMKQKPVLKMWPKPSVNLRLFGSYCSQKLMNVVLNKSRIIISFWETAHIPLP